MEIKKKKNGIVGWKTVFFFFLEWNKFFLFKGISWNQLIFGYVGMEEIKAKSESNCGFRDEEKRFLPASWFASLDNTASEMVTHVELLGSFGN